MLLLTPDSVETLGAYLDGLGTQFSVFDTPLQGEPSGMSDN